jgi:hypothetical protein
MLRVPARQRLWVVGAEEHAADPGHSLHGCDRNAKGLGPGQPSTSQRLRAAARGGPRRIPSCRCVADTPTGA